MDKKIEELPPFSDNLEDIINYELTALSQLLSFKEKQLKKYPEGQIRISKSHGTDQFRLSLPDSNSYIGKDNLSLIKTYSQKYYDTRLICLLKKNIQRLKKLKKSLPFSIIKIFDSIPDTLKAFITPVTLPDSLYTRLWQSIEYSGKPTNSSSPVHLTDKDEKVRSKSEVLIANQLLKSGIPYHYEFPVSILNETGTDRITFYPDFYCLNPQTRKEFFWEHLGMIDNPEYAVRALQKIALYQKNGIIPGKNLILSFETTQNPLTTKEIKNIITSNFL